MFGNRTHICKSKTQISPPQILLLYSLFYLVCNQRGQDLLQSRRYLILNKKKNRKLQNTQKRLNNKNECFVKINSESIDSYKLKFI